MRPRPSPRTFHLKQQPSIFMDQCWFQMVSGHTCFQLVFSFTHFSRGVVLGFFHTLSHHPAQWRQTNMVPFCWKLLNKFSKKNTCLKWWCINIISEKTMLKDYCNSNFAGQKTKEEMVFFCMCVSKWEIGIGTTQVASIILGLESLDVPWFSCILW